MFCLHGSVVLYRYKNEMDGATTAEVKMVLQAPNNPHDDDEYIARDAIHNYE